MEAKQCTMPGCSRSHTTKYSLCPFCRQQARQATAERRARAAGKIERTPRKQPKRPRPMTAEEYERMQG
jgi:hypothetical protein